MIVVSGDYDAATATRLLLLQNPQDILRNTVILQKLTPYGEQIKFLDVTCRLSDAPAEQHLEFPPASAAEPVKRRHIQCFEKGHHRVRRTHPEIIGFGAGCCFRVNDGRLHSAPLVQYFFLIDEFH